MRGSDTKDRILDVSEILFSERGFDATSLRTITAEAGVNLASVNYYFGSKDALLEAVYARRLVPMNQERVRRLDSLEQEFHGADIPLHALIAAFVEPALALSREPTNGSSSFIRLLGRSYTEPSLALQDKVRSMYEGVITRFKSAFARALPDLPSDDLNWRLHFMVGMLAYCMSGSDTMRLIVSCRLYDPLDSETLSRRLVTFLTAGMGAPAEQTAAAVLPG